MGADKCIFYFGQIYTNTSIGCQWLEVLLLGDPTFANRAFLFNIAQTAFDPPTPLVLNMYVANFFEQLFSKVRKCLSLQNSTI